MARLSKFLVAGLAVVAVAMNPAVAQDTSPANPPFPGNPEEQNPSVDTIVPNTSEGFDPPAGGPPDVDVDCSQVEEFDTEIFSDQPDAGKVYLTPSPFPDGAAGELFRAMGFDRFVRVFGNPIITTKNVSDEALLHAARIFADTLDNERTGTPARYGAVNFIRSYNTIIGYVSGPDESEMMWSELFQKPEATAFREQFVCNMHFFEQWASDATPKFHERMQRQENAIHETLDDQTLCEAADSVEFDWPLWYLPFTATYYGFLEDMTDDEKDSLAKAIVEAQKKDTFAEYPTDDAEMEMADFFVWSLLTSTNALQCYCGDNVISTVWSICTRAELKERHPEWVEKLDAMVGIPHRLPSPYYDSPAVVL